MNKDRIAKIARIVSKTYKNGIISFGNCGDMDCQMTPKEFLKNFKDYKTEEWQDYGKLLLFTYYKGVRFFCLVDKED